MTVQSKVLIVDDEEAICWGLRQLCSQMGLASESCSSVEVALARYTNDHPEDFPQAMILDVRLPGKDGLSAIADFHQRFGPIPIIVITAFGDLQTAITAIRNGAFEYLIKPFDLDKVRETLNLALATPLTPPDEQPIDDSPTGLVGQSAVMQNVFKQIALTTTNDTPVMISGESGTGKELTARAIHRFGQRNTQPFVAVNIAALNPSLVESELFGHVAGAFTGANTDREGLIQQADGGTLFLDEVAEIPLDVQVKLLRVLDQGEVTPVGSNESVRVNFRLISATHQDLASKIHTQEFRHDLFYRIRAFEIRLPALHERLDDLGPLVDSFLSRIRPDHPFSYSEEFLRALAVRRWPGNVRQLRTAIERAAVVARGNRLTPADLPDDGELLQFATPTGDSNASTTAESWKTGPQIESQLGELVRRWTHQQLDNGNETALHEKLLAIIEPPLMQVTYDRSGQQYLAAARRLGLHRTTVKKKLEG